MSTVKTDVITAVSTNGDLSLDGLGSGGVSIASTLKMTKGGDIASASPLVIDTDGNYFDVTGTTNFAAMTVEAGNFFMLQFDGALTITHGSGIELPGAANLTTAAGDRLICYATGANTVEVMNVATEAAAGGGAWSVLSSGTLANVASFDITGITKTTKIMFSFTAVGGDLGGMNIWTSSDGGSSFDSGSANYYSAVWRHDEAKGSQVHGYAGATYLFAAASSALASAAGASMAGDITLIDPQNTSNYTHVHMDYSYQPTTTECNREVAMGFRASAGRVNAIRIDPTSNNISGSYIVYELN